MTAPEAGDGRRHALIISMTPVTDEPRVARQARALHDAGWLVSVAGFAGRQQAPDFWRLLELSQTRYRRSPEFVRRRVDLWLSRVLPSVTERAYWGQADYAGNVEMLGFVAPAKYDLILAHDYFTAPIAERLAAAQSIPFSIDIHEYATEQYMHDRRWRIRERHWVRRMQQRFLPSADGLTVICDSIADLLNEEYDLPERPTVVRSVTRYEECQFQATGETMTALYHGILARGRGLEEAIRAWTLVGPHLRLVIRGNGPESYVRTLEQLTVELGVEDRVRIEGPVPASEMVKRANESADIGLFVQPDMSRHKRFTLPNKFFEYIMAGLALCVSDLPEMSRLVDRHDLGLTVPAGSPKGIAEALVTLTPEKVDHYKRRSLEAGRELNWENEQATMLALYDRLVAVAPALPAG